MKETKTLDRRTMTCPLWKKPCVKHWDNCAWKVEETRQYDNGDLQYRKCCALFELADGQPNMAQRLYALQQEMAETKNASVYGPMALLGHKHSQEMMKKIANGNESLKKLSR